ncbi:hypothetical protein B0O99DRAFT_608923 [Bisporella sp. PMI_857]|nr:hypothetical protein B0O99DRAFT_608923 [Bisporella sp. PMI_857]
MPWGVNSDYSLEACSAAIRCVPSLSGNSLYLGLFRILVVVQSMQGVCFRTWSFTSSMLSGLVLEVIGHVS